MLKQKHMLLGLQFKSYLYNGPLSLFLCQNCKRSEKVLENVFSNFKEMNFFFLCPTE